MDEIPPWYSVGGDGLHYEPAKPVSVSKRDELKSIQDQKLSVSPPRNYATGASPSNTVAASAKANSDDDESFAEDSPRRRNSLNCMKLARKTSVKKKKSSPKAQGSPKAVGRLQKSPRSIQNRRSTSVLPATPVKELVSEPVPLWPNTPYSHINLDLSVENEKVSPFSSSESSERRRLMKSWLGYGRVQAQDEHSSMQELDVSLKVGDCQAKLEDDSFASDDVPSRTPSICLDSRILKHARLSFCDDLLAASQGTLPSNRDSIASSSSDSPKSSPSLRGRLGLLPLSMRISPIRLPHIEQFRSVAENEASRRTLSAGDVLKNTKRMSDDRMDIDTEDADIANSQPVLWLAKCEEQHTGEEEGTQDRMTIMNVFAILNHKPLLGTDLFVTLREVQSAIDSFQLWATPWSLQGHRHVINYLKAHAMHDVRNNIKQAMDILAFAELPGVQWHEGYMEAFIHCAGMMRAKTFESWEFGGKFQGERRLSLTTLRNLTRAYKILSVNVFGTQESLATFELKPMWEHIVVPHDVRSCANAFSKALLDHYNSKYLNSWPPKQYGQGHRWLTRTLVRKLQDDFGVLYDHLVDRTIVWEKAESSRKRNSRIISADPEIGTVFCADTDAVPLTSLLREFDRAFALKHSPHPFPRVVTSQNKETRGSRQATPSSASVRAIKTQPSKEYASLLELFKDHENSYISSLNAHDARLVRWTIVYGVMQLLSQLTVDAEDVKYTHDVEYFLCTLVDGPPWVSQQYPRLLSELQLRSYCWTKSSPKRTSPSNSSPPEFGPLTPKIQVGPVTPSTGTESNKYRCSGTESFDLAHSPDTPITPATPISPTLAQRRKALSSVDTRDFWISNRR